MAVSLRAPAAMNAIANPDAIAAAFRTAATKSTLCARNNVGVLALNPGMWIFEKSKIDNAKEEPPVQQPEALPVLATAHPCRGSAAAPRKPANGIRDRQFHV
jgi:hypothetical protein